MNHSLNPIPQPAVPAPPATLASRWYVRLGLLLLGVGLLTAAFAPVNQFYLAWIGLVPWLLVLNSTRSRKSAFFWSWLAGTFFFIANMWWMAYVTAPGMVALMGILGLYWGATGVIIRAAVLAGIENRGSRIEDREDKIIPSGHARSSILYPRFPILKLLLIAAIFVACCEWFRGVWPWHGLPWLNLGYTQSPMLKLCQIADITGVEGITFVIVLANAWIAMWILRGFRLRGLVSAGISIVAIVAGMWCYGAYRFSHEQLTPGPTVMVVQPNYPQSNTGAKGATLEDRIDFHLRKTFEADPKKNNVDLVVWSETMMPSMNRYALDRLRNTDYGQLLRETISGIGQLCQAMHVAILTGGEEWRRLDLVDGHYEPNDKVNLSYYFGKDGVLQDRVYVKIHLVPFGEFIPFRESFPLLYKLMVKFGPPDMDAYNLLHGDDQHLTVFPLEKTDGREPWRFVTPICFEDIDADICAEMFRPDSTAPDRKRADFLVNITNDGWFKANENAQHLQAAIFRSIENRVPTARSVNTGISGFIDPLGRTYGLLAPRTQGTSIGLLKLDSRVTGFTRAGQLFSWICAGVTLLSMAVLVVRSIVHRNRAKLS